MSELLSLERLEQMMHEEAERRPDPEQLRELARRVEQGNNKILTAQANRGDRAKIREAQAKLDQLTEQLRAMVHAEMRWRAIGMAGSVLMDFKALPMAVSNARMAIVVPGVIELKVRLDGTDDVPF